MVMRVKKPSKTAQRRKADTLFSKYIRERDGECQAEGRHIGSLQCAHLVSRRYLAVRYEPTNAIALCLGHHKFYTEHPIEWRDYVRVGLRIDLEGLEAVALNRPTRPDYPAIIADLQAKLAELEEQGECSPPGY